MQTAQSRRGYFDTRAGELWDLYFAGYYRWGHMPSGIVLTRDPDGPQFSPQAFDDIRRFVHDRSAWRYSGDADLVLVNAYLARGQEPLIDWESLQGGPIVDPNGRYSDLSLGGVIERLSEGVEAEYELADWNVGDRLWPTDRGPDSQLMRFARDVLVRVAARVIGGQF